MSFEWRKWAVGWIAVSAAAVSCTQDFNAFQFQDPSGAGASSATTSTGSKGECSGPDECPKGNDCKKASCVDGACGFQVQTAGAPCDEDGGKVCDGNGGCVECNSATQMSDCPSDKPNCENHKCVPNVCKNQVKDGKETDVDCGGGDCPDCEVDKTCLVDGDCKSNICQQPDQGSGGGGAGGGGGMGGGGPSGPAVCKLEPGAQCADAPECDSGFCVDGRCCDTKCDGACVACSNAKTGGKDGECTAIKKGDDPDTECGAVVGSLCGPLGKGCSGAAIGPSGASFCEVADAMTSCVVASCDTAKNEQTAATNCDGMGTCPKPAVTSCGLYVCDSKKVACETACTGGNEASCTTKAYCKADKCAACGPNAAPMQAANPPACDAGLSSKTLCFKTCESGSCNNFVCPAGYDCTINCGTKDACKGATLTCPDDYSCTVNCGGEGACEGTSIKAGKGGTLKVACGNAKDSCKDSDVACGVNKCEVACDGASKPKAIQNCKAVPDAGTACECAVAAACQ